MHYYRLITNDGELFLTSHPSVMQMARYYNAKVRQGLKPHEVIFRVIPHRPDSAETFIASIEKNAGVSRIPDVLARKA